VSILSETPYYIAYLLDRLARITGQASVGGIRSAPPPPLSNPLFRQALHNSWDKPALGTGPSKFLGQARSWDRPFKILGTNPLLGQALQNSCDRPALGTGPSKFLGQARSWDNNSLQPHLHVGTSFGGLT